MHPDIRKEPETINAMLDDLIALFMPYGAQVLYSVEPRTFRLNPRGRARLAEAISEQRIETLTAVSADLISAFLMVILGWRQRPEAAGAIHLTMPIGTDGTIATVTSQVTTFVRKWFAPLRCTAAFMSPLGQWGDQVFDSHPMGTGIERERSAHLVDWLDQQRLLRGVFWGNALGHTLCDRLGGQERVLRDAPVFHAEPLGDGVWLQVTESFPPPREAIDRLADFLAPLTLWTRSDLTALAAPSRLRPPTGASSKRATHSEEPSPGTAQPMVPVSGLDAIEGLDIGINIHMDHAPTAEQWATIRYSLDRWYFHGFEGGFGGGFHSISDPVMDGAVIRCLLDIGSADLMLAVDSLRKRLAALPGVNVRELVLGIESVD